MHAICDKESKLKAHALGKLPLAAWLEGLAGNMQKSGGKGCGPAPETHKGLKRVTLICLLCPMLVIIHFRKNHVWNEKKR